MIYSHNTNNIPSKDDDFAMESVKKLVLFLTNYEQNYNS